MADMLGEGEMRKSRVVVLAEKNGLMKRGGLWLTSGGRVVKPGWGEYVEERGGDLQLISEEEIEIGVDKVVFDKRWKDVMKRWKVIRGQ